MRLSAQDVYLDLVNLFNFYSNSIWRRPIFHVCHAITLEFPYFELKRPEWFSPSVSMCVTSRHRIPVRKDDIETMSIQRRFRLCILLNVALQSKVVLKSTCCRHSTSNRHRFDVVSCLTFSLGLLLRSRSHELAHANVVSPKWFVKRLSFVSLPFHSLWPLLLRAAGCWLLAGVDLSNCSSLALWTYTLTLACVCLRVHPTIATLFWRS